jgi:hypothetical protein
MNSKLNIDLDRHTIKLTQGFGFEVEVTVSKFQPLPGDKTSYPWRDSAGNQQMLELPHYYIADMDSHQRVIDEYNQKSYLVYIQRLLKGKSPLMIWTLQEAIRFSETHRVCLVICCDSSNSRRAPLSKIVYDSGPEVVSLSFHG